MKKKNEQKGNRITPTEDKIQNEIQSTTENEILTEGIIEYRSFTRTNNGGSKLTVRSNLQDVPYRI
jgi:hypothetical protein